MCPRLMEDAKSSNAPHFYEKTSSVVSFSKNEITLGSDYKK
ncbi:hypothetical protein [Paenibacillus sp. RC67]|nr:hypothetical protein [Paenibacillus sp. RC67]